MRVKINAQNINKPQKAYKKKEKNSDNITFVPFVDKSRNRNKKLLDLTKDNKPSKTNNSHSDNKNDNTQYAYASNEKNSKLKKHIKYCIVFILALSCILGFLRAMSSLGTQDEKKINEIMPYVIGETQEDAVAKLEQLGMSVSVKYSYAEYFDEGTVMDTSIEYGEIIEPGCHIDLYVCKIKNNDF